MSQEKTIMTVLCSKPIMAAAIVSPLPADDTLELVRKSFVDGKPFKSGYRRFQIKTVEGTDDYASIREVVTRRWSSH